jgi:hypothetical protein
MPEAEIRRIAVPGLSVLRTYLNRKKLGMMETPVIPAMVEILK